MELKNFILVGIGLIIGIIIGVYFIGSENITGNVPSDNYECKQVSQQAQYEIIGEEECIGKKGFLGGIDNKCSIQIRNLAKQPAEFSVSYKCFTVKNSDNPEIINSIQKPLSSNQIGTFIINYNSNGREFNCRLESVIGSEVTGCILSRK